MTGLFGDEAIWRSGVLCVLVFSSLWGFSSLGF